MAFGIDLTAAFKANPQDSRGKLADFPSTGRNAAYSFKDSLKEAVNDRSTGARRNEEGKAIRKDLASRAESKLKSLKRPEPKRAEAEKPVEEDNDKMKELLLKLEELSKLQQGEVPPEKQMALLEGIRESLKELETMQGSNTLVENAELDSKISELEAKLEAMLKELKNEGSLMNEETGAEFTKELKSLISDTFAKLEETSETNALDKAAEMRATQNGSNTVVIPDNQAAAGNEAVITAVSQSQEKTAGHTGENKLTSEVPEKQVKSTGRTTEETKAAKAVQPEAVEADEEIKEALNSKIEKVTAEDKESGKQDADAENSKKAPQQVPKTAGTSQHKQVNEEMAAIRIDQAAGAKVEEVQSKVPAPKAETINKTEVINQIVKKAEVIVTDAKQEMRMQLEPENLGKLTLKLAVEKGLITAKFVAENHQVKQVIESSLNELRDMLQEKGLEVQNFSVSVGQDNKEYNNSNALSQWKETARLNSRSLNKVSYDGYQTDEDIPVRAVNPYSIHNGKFDHRA